jgi:hypothetical protein
MTLNYGFAVIRFVFSWFLKVRLSEKVSEISGQVSEKTVLESFAGLLSAKSSIQCFLE